MIWNRTVGRLARGRTFFGHGRERARRRGLPFKWMLEEVPGVGRDFIEMGEARRAPSHS